MGEHELAASPELDPLDVRLAPESVEHGPGVARDPLAADVAVIGKGGPVDHLPVTFQLHAVNRSPFGHNNVVIRCGFDKVSNLQVARVIW